MDSTDVSTRADARAEAAPTAGSMAGRTSGGRPPSPDDLVRLARANIPHADHVGLALFRDQRPPSTIAGTDDIARQADRLQHQRREGPCVDAALGAPVVVSHCLAQDRRWRGLGARWVRVTGVQSALAMRLPIGGSDRASLNLYSRRIGAFTEDDVAMAELMAPFAALVVEAHLRWEDVANLRAALESSRTIGAAVGILMTAHKVDRQQAFDLLRRASMNLNLKLRDVADTVEHTGALPDEGR